MKSSLEDGIGSLVGYLISVLAGYRVRDMSGHPFKPPYPVSH